MPHTHTQETQFLKTGHFLGLKFQEGWWFVHVLESEMDDLKPWILQNENGDRRAIAAQTAGSEDNIQDTNGRTLVIPNDDEQNIIYQVMFGFAPSRMQYFFKFGREFNNALEAFDEPGDNAPIVNGHDSPYNNPSRMSEIYTINDISPPKLQAYNPMDVSEEARVSVHVNKMKYATVTDVDVMNAMLQGQMRARLVPAGRGALRTDQVRVPNWLSDSFGEHIKTTEEIFRESQEDNQQTQQNNVPDIPGQTAGNGGSTVQ